MPLLCLVQGLTSDVLLAMIKTSGICNGRIHSCGKYLISHLGHIK